MAADLQKALSGSVRIGTAAEYRIDDGKGPGRSDPEELKRSFNPGPGPHRIGDYPGLAESLRKNEGALLEGAEDQILYFDPNVAIHSISDAYLFCCSSKITRLMIRNMWSLFGYDACLCIRDLAEFGQAIMERAPHLGLSSWENWPIDRYGLGPVKYGKPTGFQKTWDLADPYEKPADYRWQSELRIMWPGSLPRAGFTVDVPEIAPLLNEVDLKDLA